MMVFGIWFGRFVFAIFWGILLANIVWPFAGKAYAVFLILLVVLILLHLLQLAMFAGVYKPLIDWRRGDSWQIIFSGIVGWMAIIYRERDKLGFGQDPKP